MKTLCQAPWAYPALLAFAAVFSLGHLGLAAQENAAAPQTWTGVLINAACTADQAFAEAPECTKVVPGGKLALYDDNVQQVFSLDPQEQTAGHREESVTVRGTLEGTTIHVASIAALNSFGLDVHQKAPGFSARDQFGHEQTLDSLKGVKGTVLLFFRSADWCPYCKGQLIQLQAAKQRFEKQGIQLAGISYDSVEILKFFADRRKIEFPLLSDPDSKIIRAYQVLNSEATGRNKGMARPGYFFIGADGNIREKFFEAKYRERLTGNNVLSRLFPELAEQVSSDVAAPHLKLTIGQSDRVGVPGNLVTLTADVRLPADVHVYAPGTQGYKPIKLAVEGIPEIELRPTGYPRSKILYLPVIKERVPVYDGTFRIQQDVKVNSVADFSNSLGPDGKTVTISGILEYQACDSKICFLPTSVPVQWQLQILPLDRQRAPDDIRRK